MTGEDSFCRTSNTLLLQRLYAVNWSHYIELLHKTDTINWSSVLNWCNCLQQHWVSTLLSLLHGMEDFNDYYTNTIGSNLGAVCGLGEDINKTVYEQNSTPIQNIFVPQWGGSQQQLPCSTCQMHITFNKNNKNEWVYW